MELALILALVMLVGAVSALVGFAVGAQARPRARAGLAPSVGWRIDPGSQDPAQDALIVPPGCVYVVPNDRRPQ